jgi:hypothetical protein
MNLIFTLLLCILSVVFAAEEHTSDDLSKSSPATPKDTSVGCLQKRDGMPLYRRGGGCSRFAVEADNEAPARIAFANPGYEQTINLNLASANGGRETMGKRESLDISTFQAEPPREELEGAALEADERRLLSQDGFDESREGRHMDQMNGLMHGHDEFNQPNSHGELDFEHYDTNPNNVRYDSAYRHEMAPQDTTNLEGMELNRKACRSTTRSLSCRSERPTEPTPTLKPYSVAPLVKAPGEY